MGELILFFVRQQLRIVPREIKELLINQVKIDEITKKIKDLQK